MSQKRRSGTVLRGQAHAPAFAALGDETRLLLLARLSNGHRLSITQLTEGSAVTRQAITRHLHVLESAGIVRCARAGRESLFEFNPEPLEELREYLEQVSRQWDLALGRLKSFVEAENLR